MREEYQGFDLAAVIVKVNSTDKQLGAEYTCKKMGGKRIILTFDTLWPTTDQWED